MPVVRVVVLVVILTYHTDCVLVLHLLHPKLPRKSETTVERLAF